MKWGIISIVINWIPGLVGVIQIIADYRVNPSTPFQKVMLMSLGCFIFCPLIPTITTIYILFKQPRNSKEANSIKFQKDYKKLLSFASMVKALEGCLESPLQLVFKLFLMFNGIVKFDFTTSVELSDLHGNTIHIPFLLNFGIAIVSLLKSVVMLNIENIERPSKSCLLNLVPFLLVTTFFKLGALTMLFGYFNIFALLLFVLVFIIGIFLNNKTLKDNETVPRSLLIFLNIFVPICFTPTISHDFHKVQIRNLKNQMWSCLTIYGLNLIVLCILVNLSLLSMNQDIPINSAKFNWIMGSIFIFGFLSFLFSFTLQTFDNKSRRKSLMYFLSSLQMLLPCFILICFLTVLMCNFLDRKTALFIVNHDSYDEKIFEMYEVIPVDPYASEKVSFE